MVASCHAKIGISLHVWHGDLEFVDNIRNIIQTPISQNCGFKGVYATKVLTHAQQWQEKHYQMLQTYEKAMSIRYYCSSNTKFCALVTDLILLLS